MAYDSITLPTRTRTEHAFSMDMHDLTDRVNIHGQRKIAAPTVAVLFNHPGKGDLLRLGWEDILGEKGLTATVFRGEVKDVDDLTKLFSRGDIVTERYFHTCSKADGRIIHPEKFPLPTSFPKIFPSHSQLTSLSTFSSLSSKPSNVTAKLKHVADDARRFSATEEREELVNSIGEITSYHEEGYDDDFE